MGKAFEFKNNHIEEAIKQVGDLEKQFKQIQEKPDKFNHYFSERGWIAFESLNFDIMVKCVELAEKGRIDEAEDVLLDYFNDQETISFLIKRLTNIEEFRPRRTLILNALEDHFNGRYHASVPVILMMIDGFVNDIEQIGFFAENVNLNVWDTIAAHDSGLNTIANIFRRSRKKTTDEEISLPYRNGILHGRDLGYANVKVSAKALSTLLALGDWATAIKKGIDKEYVSPTFEESIQEIVKAMETMKETKKQREFMDKWKRREIIVGSDIPEKGEVGDFEEGTPERTVVEFLNYLAKTNYGNMAKLITKLTKQDINIGKLAGELRELFARKKLVDFKLIAIYDNAPAITEIETLLEFEKEDDTRFQHNRKFRLIYQDEKANPIPRGYAKAEWKIFLNFQDIEYIDLKPMSGN
jgi:hypothetical protein